MKTSFLSWYKNFIFCEIIQRSGVMDWRDLSLEHGVQLGNIKLIDLCPAHST